MKLIIILLLHLNDLKNFIFLHIFYFTVYLFCWEAKLTDHSSLDKKEVFW